MPLTVKRIEAAKPKGKVHRIGDGNGLYLEIPPKGSKRWRLRYIFEGKEKMVSLGTYPEISLKDARDKRDDMRRLLAKGINPSEQRQEQKAQAEGRDHFKNVALEWVQKHSRGKTEGHIKTVTTRLENYVFPFIGSTPISQLTPQDLLKVVLRIENRGAIETARRVRGICSQIFRYAIVLQLAERDPAADIRDALSPASATAKHHAAIIDEKGIAELMRAIHAFEGTFIVQSALRFAPLTFVRPGELRNAEWAEINLDAAEWRIPAEKMKARKPHIVPLSKQAIVILEELQPLTGHGKYVFPGVRNISRPLSENTVNAALRRLGYSKEEMTGHGFRSMASTRLNELGWNRDVIERQLAHIEGNSVRAAYNHADYLPERKRMMQWWADYLDSLKAGGKIIPFPKASNS